MFATTLVLLNFLFRNVPSFYFRNLYKKNFFLFSPKDDLQFNPPSDLADESNMSALDLYTDMVVRDSEEAALSMAKVWIIVAKPSVVGFPS